MTSQTHSVKRQDSKNSREQLMKNNEPENDSDASNPRYDTMDVSIF